MGCAAITILEIDVMWLLNLQLLVNKVDITSVHVPIKSPHHVRLNSKIKV